MSLRNSPVRFALLVAGLGILVAGLNAFLLIVYPVHVLPDAAQEGYLDAWFYPVAALGGSVLSYGVPLAAAAGGYYYVRVDRASVRRVVAGFVAGGLALGVGVVVVGWLVTHPQVRGTTLGYVGGIVETGGRFAVAAALGALAGWLLESRRSRYAPTPD